jgi:hypothetical protein
VKNGNKGSDQEGVNGLELLRPYFSKVEERGFFFSGK